jgi:hypothetical protein
MRLTGRHALAAVAALTLVLLTVCAGGAVLLPGLVSFRATNSTALAGAALRPPAEFRWRKNRKFPSFGLEGNTEHWSDGTQFTIQFTGDYKWGTIGIENYFKVYDPRSQSVTSHPDGVYNRRCYLRPPAEFRWRLNATFPSFWLEGNTEHWSDGTQFTIQFISDYKWETIGIENYFKVYDPRSQSVTSHPDGYCNNRI